MNVKLENHIFLSALLIIFISFSTQKILPSFISHFHQLTADQTARKDNVISHLSKNFDEQTSKAPRENIKISPQVYQTASSLQSNSQERQLGAAENYAAFDINFETTEIKDAVAFIEFKMKEIESLVKECIEQEYKEDSTADILKIKHECAGSSFQILFFNYNEGMKKIKELLLEILKLKLQNLKEDYEDETNFFLDVLESLVSKDYTIPKSLELAKKASKYYVSPRYFDRLIELTKPEIDAFTELHDRLREQRNEIQDKLDEKEHDEEEFVHEIEHKAHSLESHGHDDHHDDHGHGHDDHHVRQLNQYSNDQMMNAGSLIPQTSQSYSNYPQQMQQYQTATPPVQKNSYFDKVENQLDGLSLFHNPAMPSASSKRSGMDGFKIPFTPGQGNPFVKKI